jgi:hypothetical protein
MFSEILSSVKKFRSVSSWKRCQKRFTTVTKWRFDTQHNDIQHSDSQNNDIQHNDTLFKLIIVKKFIRIWPILMVPQHSAYGVYM